MNVRHSRWIAPTSLALAVTSAWAGQITLYERPDFRGPSVVANERIDTVARQGLGDTASSLVVSDGKWEVCTQPYFRGRCTELSPGNYPSLSVSLNGRVASARQIGYADPSPVTMAPQSPVVVNLPQVVVNPPTVNSTQPLVINPAPIVVNPRVDTLPPPAYTTSVPTGRAYLYENPNFGGAWVAMDRGEANDLDWAHFSNPNHRATSIRVESGNWLFCTDMAFRGDCRVLGPGDYPQLAGVLTPGIVSARQVYGPQYGAADLYRRW